ncbi:MAG: hypothetical protein AMJ78_02115 [Omnitrophica WOR_2 bacterium SM23_29]|nr:MAG: hypothetical protein AMJ78_02115 [Omnitrophica WOR_2 bacterium SM23_29]
MIRLRQKNIYIGIDIGSSSIKVVEVEIGLTGEPILRKASTVKKSEGLKKAISGMRLKGARVVGVVDCQKTCVRQLTIPVMPDKEIIEAIKWEAKDKIPFSLEKSIISYNVQQETEEAGVKKLKVAVAVSPVETVNKVIDLLREVGIEPVSLIEPPLALEYLSRHLNLNKDQTVALIDIGCEFTTIAIVRNNILKFYRKVTLGGSAITKAMTGQWSLDKGRIEISEEEAEKIKQKYGIPKGTDEVLIDEKIPATHLRSLIRPAVERLLNEIERSFEYYREESSGDKVNSVILFGGTAQFKGLDEFLQEELGISVSVGNPLQRMNVAKGAFKYIETISHMFAIALGAALSEGQGINLLPKELKEKTKRTFERAGVEAVVAAVVVTLILTFIGMRLQIVNYNKKINSGNLELKAIVPQLELASDYERIQGEISKREYLIKWILSNTPLWKEVFKELSNIVPKDIVLTEMGMKDNVLVIKGRILSALQNREEVLSNFISALEGTMFKHVSLLSAKMGDQEKEKSEFEIKCEF